ncbi:hypothetical protein [Amycolatopsis sp. DG1A-15b]|uniref:hypothetical protein n=1 Tax=Amycolatopsis sp. DG1A-15b TaxID=3052846 RepID=UPI00255B63F9|nr:hypothetical protein [Amycolatopsis sp. DG1A-15b]WIX85822.1 hypothetical protein QRY02_32050 [Amycolatopsis sp. DG1A-15b]
MPDARCPMPDARCPMPERAAQIVRSLLDSNVQKAGREEDKILARVSEMDRAAVALARTIVDPDGVD